MTSQYITVINWWHHNGVLMISDLFEWAAELLTPEDLQLINQFRNHIIYCEELMNLKLNVAFTVLLSLLSNICTN